LNTIISLRGGCDTVCAPCQHYSASVGTVLGPSRENNEGVCEFVFEWWAVSKLFELEAFEFPQLGSLMGMCAR
jgi:hypothetical protein